MYKVYIVVIITSHHSCGQRETDYGGGQRSFTTVISHRLPPASANIISYGNLITL